MRKAFFLLCLAAGLLSCAKDALNSGEGDTQNEGAPMTFNVTVAETKAVKADWADGDKIYVFFNGLATKYLVLTYDGTEWTNTSGGGTLLDSDFSDLGTKTLTAVHFPVAVDVSYDVDMDSNGWFSFTSGANPCIPIIYLKETRTILSAAPPLPPACQWASPTIWRCFMLPAPRAIFLTTPLAVR